MLRDGDAPEPFVEGCHCARYIRLDRRIARLPPTMTRAPLALTCPHCGYRGETAVEGSPSHGQFFPGFRLRELLYVYHDIVAAGHSRTGMLFHFSDSKSMEINEMEPVVETSIECGNCDQLFPWEGPVWGI